jgi:DNA-directed RNA polymerase sigma subunit (sigma70/sigma32)
MLRSSFYLASSSLLRHALLYPALSADEEHQLALDGCAGSSSASERIILCNLRLAVSIARDYTGLGLTLEDLVSEGSVGLMKAAAKFDPYHRTRTDHPDHAFWNWYRRRGIVPDLGTRAPTAQPGAGKAAAQTKRRQP